jgi:deoxyadenosine/deoxycytidine kinase
VVEHLPGKHKTLRSKSTTRERERERERENEQRDYYSEIKSIIREYHEQLFTNKINNPDELTT